jgi:hypothetical protein
MPSGRGVAGAVTFPRPRTGTCTAGAPGTNARPRGRFPTAEPGRAATVAATAVGSAKGATPSVETATRASVGATPSAATAVTTAMLSKGGRGEANEAEGYDSQKKSLERGGLFHITTFHRDFRLAGLPLG